MEVLCFSSVLQQQQKEETWTISKTKKTPKNKTLSAIFHTSGRKLEAYRGEQDASVLQCIFSC